MDIISHGLWGGVLTGRKGRKQFAWAVFFGALPDLSSFGIFLVLTFLGVGARADWSAGPPSMESIPSYVHTLYNISHSLITFLFFATILYFFVRHLFIPFFAYGFAVLLDIPTHSTNFFATPFLWPLSSYKYDGTPWSESQIFIPNVILVLTAYLVWYLYIKKKRASSLVSKE